MTKLLLPGLDKVRHDTIVGHSFRGMDAYYLQSSDEDLVVAVDRYTAWIDNQFANVPEIVTQATFLA